jgi:hypothetical protein
MKSPRNTSFLLILALFITIGIQMPALAQVTSDGSALMQSRKSVGGAFLRSLIAPGWGHRFVNDDWGRGRIHLGSDIAFLGAALGYNQQANNTRDAMYTTARQMAGVDIKGRDKAFQLAVAQYNSLEEYNRTMEQTRNWDRFYEVNSENNWEWSSEDDRVRYNNLRGKSDNSRRQAGIFVGLMAVNRVVSGVSSMVAARNHNRNLPSVVIVPDFGGESTGLAAQVTIRF